MFLFLDSNIYLSFYFLSNDDLEELSKLNALLENKECLLITTEQVICEFHRNREKKIREAIESLKSQKLDFRYPQLCKDYPEFEELRTIQRTYSDIHGKLLDQILSDVDTMKLKADETINKLIKNSIKYNTTDEIYQLAKKRYEIGNPPGKDGSIGDAINWELLLLNLENGTELCFISDDKDFFSPLNNCKFNHFLFNEWKVTKGTELAFFKSLSSFFNLYYPEIKIASDVEKVNLINKLANSDSFEQTRAIVAELGRYGTEFSSDQVNSIISASNSNKQVYQIINDEDIQDFLMSVTGLHLKEIDQSILMKLLTHCFPDGTDNNPFFRSSNEK